VNASVAPQVHGLIAPFVAAVTADRATIRAIGNGGSSAIAQTLTLAAHEILGPSLRRTRCVGVWDRYRLMDEVSRNGFEQSAVHLLARDQLAEPDLVLLISGSGNSRNLVAVARHCLSHRVPVVSITGRSGGVLGMLGVSGIRVDSDDQQVIEDCAHAGIQLLLQAVAAALSEGDDCDAAIARSGAAIRGALRPDVAWVDHVSSALARAAACQGRVTVIAPEGGALGLSVEHIVHNLGWDLCHQMPGAQLTVRSGVSLADYTGVVNDSGKLGLAESRLLEDASTEDVTIIFAHDADHPSVELVRQHAATVGLPVHGWYGMVAHPKKNEDLTVVQADNLRRVLCAQVTGHVLLRAARAKIPRYFGERIGPADEAARAWAPVAPLASHGQPAELAGA
jgi:hypothetical protein